MNAATGIALGLGTVALGSAAGSLLVRADGEHSHFGPGHVAGAVVSGASAFVGFTLATRGFDRSMSGNLKAIGVGAAALGASLLGGYGGGSLASALHVGDHQKTILAPGPTGPTGDARSAAQGVGTA